MTTTINQLTDKRQLQPQRRADQTGAASTIARHFADQQGVCAKGGGDVPQNDQRCHKRVLPEDDHSQRARDQHGGHDQGGLRDQAGQQQPDRIQAHAAGQRLKRQATAAASAIECHS